MYIYDDDYIDDLWFVRMTGGELFDYLACRDKVDEATAIMFLRQVLEGVRHLHEQNIVHLDLKVSGSVSAVDTLTCHRPIKACPHFEANFEDKTVCRCLQ